MRNLVKKAIRSGAIAVLPIAMLLPMQTIAYGATTATTLTLYAPKDLAGVPELPFTGNRSADFTLPDQMASMDVTPNNGPVGTPITITGKGLAPSTSLTLTWSTADGAWLADVQPNTVNYMGLKYSKYNMDMTKVTTDANGGFVFKTTVPLDWGGPHDIYAVSNGAALAHGGFQTNPHLSFSPASGPIGTPVHVTYSGMAPTLYTGGAAVLWDNKSVGEAQAVWTRGVADFKIRAAGPVGNHFLQINVGLNAQYMNIRQSPVPYARGGIGAFRVTKDAGAPAASIEWPSKVKPSVTARTTLGTAGLDPATQAQISLSSDSGEVGSTTKMHVTNIPNGSYDIVLSSVQGNRVNCPTSTCWVYNPLKIGTVTVTNGVIENKDVTIPDNLGGWHVIQVKKGDLIEAQEPFYVKESIFIYKDSSGKTLSNGIAASDPTGLPEDRAGSGVPKSTFKEGEEFTIAMKGVGWTQFDNTLAITYDNAFVGYSCGFNSNGYMVAHLYATGGIGTHIIDLHPLLYTNQPSFDSTPYGMQPVLSYANDFPSLALGYQPPAVHFAITITK